MSRIGRKPIPIPQGVTVAIEGNTVRVVGPKGKLSHTLPAGVSVAADGSVLTVGRSSDHRTVRALHGLTRSLIANIVHGVKDGFERKLEIATNEHAAKYTRPVDAAHLIVLAHPFFVQLSQMHAVRPR